MSPPHILIIGGGIGGLALAQGLKKNNISFTLFERDISPEARAQGYRVRIAGVGGECLHECLDDELWKLFEDTCAEIKYGGSRLNAIDGTEMENIFPTGRRSGGPPGMKFFPGKEGPKPPAFGEFKAYTVDRTLLRNLLLLNQDDHVKFGKQFTHYEVTPSGVTAFFKDGTSEQGTLLVGADGPSSRVRRQFLPNIRYIDTGCRAIYGKTPLTPEFESLFPSEILNKGMTIIQNVGPPTLVLEAIRFPKDAAVESNGRLASPQDYVYWVYGGEAKDICSEDAHFLSLSGQATADLSLSLTSNWKPEFRSIFEYQTVSQSATLKLLSAKPERPIWPPSTKVTLLGDAIHTMIPAGGPGANGALADAALLVRTIVEKGVSEDSMGRYIDDMWGYMLPMIQGSTAGGAKLLGFKTFEDAKEVDF